MRRSILPLLAGPALLLAACGDAGDRVPPAGPRGLYSLYATGVGPIPAVLGTRDGCTYTAAAGHVSLLARGRYEAMLIRERKCDSPAAGADTVFMDQGAGTFAVSGDSLRFQSASGGTSGVGALRGDTLVVRGPGQTLYYSRNEEMSRRLLESEQATADTAATP